MGTQKDSEATRAKIIEAAGQLFAVRGFHGVTVRDIAKKADIHFSLLNYHFKGKDALYREVLLHACRSALMSPEERDYLQDLDPQEALFLFAKETINIYSKQPAFSWKLAIIDREFWEPSPVFEEVFEEYIKPETDFIAEIISRISGKPKESLDVRFSIIGLTGLLSIFGYYNHYVDAIAPDIREISHEKDCLVRKIVSMAMDAVKDTDIE